MCVVWLSNIAVREVDTCCALNNINNLTEVNQRPLPHLNPKLLRFFFRDEKNWSKLIVLHKHNSITYHRVTLFYIFSPYVFSRPCVNRNCRLFGVLLSALSMDCENTRQLITYFRHLIPILYCPTMDCVYTPKAKRLSFYYEIASIKLPKCVIFLLFYRVKSFRTVVW